MAKAKKYRSEKSGNNKPTLAVTIRRLETAIAELQSQVAGLVKLAKSDESEMESRIQTLEAKTEHLTDPRHV